MVFCFENLTIQENARWVTATVLFRVHYNELSYHHNELSHLQLCEVFLPPEVLLQGWECSHQEVYVHDSVYGRVYQASKCSNVRPTYRKQKKLFTLPESVVQRHVLMQRVGMRTTTT